MRYSPISTEKPIGKHEMFNEKPSENSTFWHFEFRGYGEMRSKWNTVAKEYLKILMNLWIAAIEYYKRNNIAKVKNVRVKQSLQKTSDLEQTLQEQLKAAYDIPPVYYRLKWDTGVTTGQLKSVVSKLKL